MAERVVPPAIPLNSHSRSRANVAHFQSISISHPRNASPPSQASVLVEQSPPHDETLTILCCSLLEIGAVATFAGLKDDLDFLGHLQDAIPGCYAYCTINVALDSTNVAIVRSARPRGRNLSSEMKMRTRQDTSTSRENKMRMSRMRTDE
ncbi:hypothetical protein M405DRAFT_833502 [Rhizopogon salebrosus TDB-379]|nr:hypothetical protein M405DRAFT_833502 [Rhizopogon salebrosus TDB-379]